LPVLPLECHLQGTQQVGYVQSFAHLVGATESVGGCNGQAAEEEMLKVNSRALDCVLGRRATWAVATRLWLAKGLPQRNLLCQAPNLRVEDAPDLLCSLSSPSVDGDDLLGEKEALP